MPALRAISNSQAFDFTKYRVARQITSGSSSYTAISSGAVIAISGNRLWDSSLLPASGTIAAPNILKLPLLNNPPATKFDAIIDLVVDGISYPIAFSNSLDNVAAVISETTAPSNIFWISLLRIRPNAVPLSATSALDYYFGGDPFTYSGSSSSNILRLNLAEPLTGNTSFSYTMQYIGIGSIATAKAVKTE